jgi:hypothetical protein
VKEIKDDMKGKNYKLTVDKLRLLVTYKKTKKTQPYLLGRLISLLNGMKPSTAFLRDVVQTIPTMKRKRRRRRRRRRRGWAPLD